MIFLTFLLCVIVAGFSLMMGWGLGKFIFVAINHWIDCSNTKERIMQIVLDLVLAFVIYFLILSKF